MNINIYSVVFQVINDLVHVSEAATVTILAGAVVAVGKVAVSRLDIDTVFSSDMVNEVLCTCSTSRTITAATFIQVHIFLRYHVHLNVVMLVYCSTVSTACEKEESVVSQRFGICN
jgi:2-phosphoglycerate kinase